MITLLMMTMSPYPNDYPYGGKLTMSKTFSAEEIHDLVSDIMASGSPNWPVSRKCLKGLRLRQVKDAIKMHVAIVYFRYLDGEISALAYEGLKKNWPAVLPMLPVAFTRDEVWQECKHLDPKERSIQIVARSAGFASDPDVMNEEELEFINDEDFDSFIRYLEILCEYHDDPLDHVLGHLSRNTVYFRPSVTAHDG